MDQVIRLGIAHRFQLFNESLTTALRGRPHLRIVGTARTSYAALDLVKTQPPDVLLLDPFFEDKDGLDLVPELLAHHGDLRVVVLMMEPRFDYADRLMRAGARGLVSPVCAEDDLVKTIATVFAGRTALPAAFSREMQHSLQQVKERADRPLTNREMQVLTMIAEGKSKMEIAQKLYIGIKTVDTHRANLKDKLGLRNNMEIVLYAVRHGYVRA